MTVLFSFCEELVVFSAFCFVFQAVFLASFGFSAIRMSIGAKNVLVPVQLEVN